MGIIRSIVLSILMVLMSLFPNNNTLSTKYRSYFFQCGKSEIVGSLAELIEAKDLKGLKKLYCPYVVKNISDFDERLELFVNTIDKYEYGMIDDLYETEGGGGSALSGRYNAMYFTAIMYLDGVRYHLGISYILQNADSEKVGLAGLILNKYTYNEGENGVVVSAENICGCGFKEGDPGYYNGWYK